MVQQPRFWQHRGWVAWLLWPLSLLFALLVALRRQLYRQGWLPRYRAPVPVVVVGNITVGGNGKTPLVMALVQALHADGVACVVVSRGYGGTLHGVAEVTTDSAAALVGDEPLLIRQTTGVPVFVGRRRADAVQAALHRYPQTQLVVCDDGLQHYALARDMEIVVVAGDFGVGNGWLLPAGPLREGLTRLMSVDAVVVNGGNVTMARHFANAYDVQASCTGAQPLDGGRLYTWAELATLPRLYLLTAIARPQRVQAMLDAAGVTLTGARFAADHAPLSAADAAFVGDDGWLLVTAKDAVKLVDFPPELRARTLVLDYRLSVPPALLAQVRHHAQQ